MLLLSRARGAIRWSTWQGGACGRSAFSRFQIADFRLEIGSEGEPEGTPRGIAGYGTRETRKTRKGPEVLFRVFVPSRFVRSCVRRLSLLRLEPSRRCR